jgi:hypothetical protein
MITHQPDSEDLGPVGQEHSDASDTPVRGLPDPSPRGPRLFGLPIQFVIVAAASLILTIYLGAWTADARIEARAESGPVASAHGFPAPSPSVATGGQAVDSQGGWESAFLLVCPFH